MRLNSFLGLDSYGHISSDVHAHVSIFISEDDSIAMQQKCALRESEYLVRKLDFPTVGYFELYCVLVCNMGSGHGCTASSRYIEVHIVLVSCDLQDPG